MLERLSARSSGSRHQPVAGERGGVAVGVVWGVRARAPRGRGMMEQGHNVTHKSLSGECMRGWAVRCGRAGGVAWGAGWSVDLRRDLNREYE